MSDDNDGATLKRRLRRAEQRQKLKAFGLVAPLLLFTLVSFALPTLLLLFRSVDNPEFAEVMPRTAAALRAWDGRGLPDEATARTFVEELAVARTEKTLGVVATRLNYDIVGMRSLMFSTARKLPKSEPASYRDALIAIKAAWGERATWAALRRAAQPLTPFYLLAAVDRTVDADGAVVPVAPEQALFVGVYLRTFWMAGVVSLLCLLLGYPLAYLLATVPTRIGNLLMILVLLPFWTSLLVRTAAWVVVLQKQGLVNDLLVALGIVEAPLQLVFNRIGVYVAMVHILLPFMVLPLYSVMKGIPPIHMRAAASLGANPFTAFTRVYLPQTLPGLAAGCLLVFIVAIGYYITPALLGGPQDQMISYFVAYYTNQTINWGMAAALASVLLTSTMVLYAVYDRAIGVDRMALR